MTRPIALSDDDLDWLRSAANDESITYVAMARRIGVCVDTLKRILVRYGIKDFTNPKYFAANQKPQVPTWTRPCMICGDTKPRPKPKYICHTCKLQRDWKDDDLL